MYTANTQSMACPDLDNYIFGSWPLLQGVFLCDQYIITFSYHLQRLKCGNTVVELIFYRVLSSGVAYIQPDLYELKV